MKMKDQEGKGLIENIGKLEAKIVEQKEANKQLELRNIESK